MQQRRSTSGAIKPRKSLSRDKENKLDSLFYPLKELLEVYELHLQVKTDNENQYELWTSHSYRLTTVNPKTIVGIQFGAVIKCQKHVSLFLHALYFSNEIKEGLSDNLKVLVKAKTALHIKELNEEILKEIELVMKKCWAFYESKNWVTIKS
jgi:hypothetical protein